MACYHAVPEAGAPRRMATEPRGGSFLARSCRQDTSGTLALRSSPRCFISLASPTELAFLLEINVLEMMWDTFPFAVSRTFSKGVSHQQGAATAALHLRPPPREDPA
jgi:hypothetical protein